MSAATRNAPTIRLQTPESTARTLAAHIARHNLRVLLLAAGTLLVSAAAWLLLYFLSTWILVLAVAVFDVRLTRIPPGYTILFAVSALCSLVYVGVDRWLTPNDRPSDKKRPLDVVADFLLAIPRMTFSVAGTLAAWQRLSSGDLRQAATLLHRISEEKRVPMSSVPLDIPNPDSVMRILFALQITQVIDVFRDNQEFWLRLSTLRPPSLKLSREPYADA